MTVDYLNRLTLLESSFQKAFTNTNYANLMLGYRFICLSNGLLVLDRVSCLAGWAILRSLDEVFFDFLYFYFFDSNELSNKYQFVSAVEELKVKLLSSKKDKLGEIYNLEQIEDSNKLIKTLGKWDCVYPRKKKYNDIPSRLEESSLRTKCLSDLSKYDFDWRPKTLKSEVNKMLEALNFPKEYNRYLKLFANGAVHSNGYLAELIFKGGNTEQRVISNDLMPFSEQLLNPFLFYEMQLITLENIFNLKAPQ